MELITQDVAPYEVKNKDIFENTNNILEIEICDICMYRGVSKIVFCETCKKHMCVACLQQIKIPGYEPELEKKDGVGLFARYNCPYCRQKNDIPFTKFRFLDILYFNKYDYNNYFNLNHQFDKYKNEHQDLYMLYSKANHYYKNKPDELVEFLIEENQELKKTNKLIFEVAEDNEKLKKEITSLKADADYMETIHFELINNNKKLKTEMEELLEHNKKIVAETMQLRGLLKLTCDSHNAVIDTISKNTLNKSLKPAARNKLNIKYLKEFVVAKINI